MRVEQLISEGSGQSGMRAVGVVTDNPTYRELRGQLVVDCSGRAALGGVGLEGAQASDAKRDLGRLRCRLRVTRVFSKVRDDSPYLNKAMTARRYCFPHHRVGVISPLEGNQWVVTLGGSTSSIRPTTSSASRRSESAFRRRSSRSGSRTPSRYRRCRTFRRLEMRWNHFPSARFPLHSPTSWRWATRLWASNPLYGQGMSIGVTCARILRDVLREDAGSLGTLARRFYPAAKKFAFPAWESTALLDLAWPGTEGKRPW